MALRRTVSAAALLALAGQAIAQPTVDGSLSGDEAFYGSIKWSQNQPTAFGDNHPSNVPPAGDASTADKGIELWIPFSAIGSPTGNGDITMAGWVTSADHTFMSNQVIGGLPNLGNLGGSPIDFTAISGTQQITITATTGGTAPTIDGDLDAVYGAAQDGWLQNNFTGFGDADHGNVDGGSGSEIDSIYAWADGQGMYLFIAGNLEANGNGLVLAFDTIAGGQLQLRDDNPVVDNPSGDGSTDVVNAMSPVDFDGTEADFLVLIAGRDDSGDGSNFITGAHFVELADDGDGDDWFLGNGTYGPGGGGALTGADSGAPAVMMAIDNSNVDGVAGSPPVTIPSPDDAVGSEVDGVYSYHDELNGRLYVLVTGNLETSFNKIALFLDALPGGQQTLRGDNIDDDFNGLNRMGGDGTDPGLTFEPGFEADYWIRYTNGAVPVEHYSGAAVLRTNGPIRDLNLNLLDYASNFGGVKGTVPVLDYSGPQLDIQDGFTPQPRANYAPRLAGQSLQADPFNPVGTPNLLEMVIDNSNIAGVTADSAVGSELVTTGLEICIDLEELGWDGKQDIKLAGAVTNGGYDFWSNQVIGGLPGSPAENLGEPRVIDFGQIDGEQCVTVLGGECLADWNGVGGVNTSDFIAYLNDYNAVLNGGSPTYGDPDLAPPLGVLNTSDFIAFLNIFNAGCD